MLGLNPPSEDIRSQRCFKSSRITLTHMSAQEGSLKSTTGKIRELKSELN
jgi:hypothetical protein